MFVFPVMSRFFGVGRFARARGTSHFARAFNGDLPRFVSYAPSFAIPFAKLGELPLSGFAEQRHPLLGLLNAMRLSESACDVEAGDGEEAISVAGNLWDAVELLSCFREWSGNTIEVKQRD